jgi:hypothetical protein
MWVKSFTLIGIVNVEQFINKKMHKYNVLRFLCKSGVSKSLMALLKA